MTVRFRNTQKQRVTIAGKDTDMYTPMLVAAGMSLPDDTFQNVEVSEGSVISDGSNQIVAFACVPGLNDSLEDMGKMQALAKSFSNLEKIEWLPFHNLCVEKYQSLGIPFPLAGTDNMDEEALQRLVEQLNAEGA